MKESSVDWSKVKDIPIPEYDWRNGNPDEFYETFVKKPHPVILRGFLNGRDIMKYTFDYIIEKYGEESVILMKKNSTAVVNASLDKLKKVADGEHYLPNSEVLFQRHPELKDMIETDSLEPYLGSKKCTFAQLFVGKGGTGTSLHHAGVWNFFHMVDGKKKWYFISPQDFYFAYPYGYLGRNVGIHALRYPDDDFMREDLKAFQYCPTYSAILEPGDVLLNPPWWGHGIRNMTNKTVGVATRWHTGGLYGTCGRTIDEEPKVAPFETFLTMLGPKSLYILQTLLRHPLGSFDEHSLLNHREKSISKSADQFYHKRRIHGWRPIF